MKLSVKIAVSMGSLAVLMAGMGVYLMMRMADVNDVSNIMADRRIPLITTLGEVNNAASEYRRAEVLHIYATSPDVMEGYEKQMAEFAALIAKGLEELKTLITQPEPKALLNDTLRPERLTARSRSRCLSIRSESAPMKLWL